MSVFLEVPLSTWVASNAHAFAFRDRYPVSPGHTLIVTRRVIPDWFAATQEERLAVLSLVDEVKTTIDREHRPDGYNVGFNAGSVAGQTVMHLHVHVIPRYQGDMDDPRGGVRHVIPSKGNYVRDVAPLATGGEGDPFARHVFPLFNQATEITIVAAFVQESGLRRIRNALHGALARGANVRVVTGDYLEITQASALELLLDWQQTSVSNEDEAPVGRFEARVVEVATLPGRARSFHPKSWCFASETLGIAFVGSSNLSRSALDTGIEWNLRVDRDRDTQAYNRVREAFEITWRSPTSGELQRMGYLPSRLRERHGSWFDFVRDERDLQADEGQVVTLAREFLREVETTEMTKCFKMVTLAALAEADALLSGLPVRDLALRSHALLRRSPELFADVSEDLRADLSDPTQEEKWIAYWRRNPIAEWTGEKQNRRAWLRLNHDRLVLAIPLDLALEGTLARLTRELIDYRLAQYRARRRQTEGTSEGFVCKVMWNQHDPILKLPGRVCSELPEGETDVRLEDGSLWQFRFAKQYCNVARPAGTSRNQLPDLMRRWFGPRAGQPGTAFELRFHRSPDGLWAEPVQATVTELVARHGVLAYPDLRAAAGHAIGALELLDQEHVLLPIDAQDPDLFAVRVTGTSMDGGRDPLHDGDWAVMRVARGAPSSALRDRVVLVQMPGESFGSRYQIKRLRRRDNHWLLTSDNPTGPTIEPREDMAVIARLDRVVHPEDLAPVIGTVLDQAELAARFGLESLEARSGRHGGHLFVLIDRKGLLEAPDRLRYTSIPGSRRGWRHPRARRSARRGACQSAALPGGDSEGLDTMD